MMAQKYTPSDFFKAIPIRDPAEAEKILCTVLGILCYLKEGDILVTPFVNFQKLQHDIIYVQHKRSRDIILDELEKNNITKFL